MQQENNTGAKVIGVMALIVAAWGVYNVFKNTDKPKQKLEGYKKGRK